MSSIPPANGRIRVGVSSCLLGEAVRYDGGHRHDRYVTQTLGSYFEYVPICPEMAIGLGTPRPPIHLCGDAVDPRAVGVRDPGLDVSDRLREHAEEVARTHADTLSGYLLKRASPSCGMERVKVHGEKGETVGTSAGLYAGRLMALMPLTPFEEEGRLNDPILRENFIVRVFAYHRWQQTCAGGLTAGRLVEFHTRHKFQILAHDETAYRRLGRLVADAGRGDVEALGREYAEGFMDALRHRATRRRHANVLQHLAGFLKREIDAPDRKELLALIDDYRAGRVPLVVPMTLLRHHFRRNPDPYVEFQHYLAPYPADLALRNRI